MLSKLNIHINNSHFTKFSPMLRSSFVLLNVSAIPFMGINHCGTINHHFSRKCKICFIRHQLMLIYSHNQHALHFVGQYINHVFNTNKKKEKKNPHKYKMCEISNCTSQLDNDI